MSAWTKGEVPNDAAFLHSFVSRNHLCVEMGRGAIAQATNIDRPIPGFNSCWNPQSIPHEYRLSLNHLCFEEDMGVFVGPLVFVGHVAPSKDHQYFGQLLVYLFSEPFPSSALTFLAPCLDHLLGMCRHDLVAILILAEKRGGPVWGPAFRSPWRAKQATSNRQYLRE